MTSLGHNDLSLFPYIHYLHVRYAVHASKCVHGINNARTMCIIQHRFRSKLSLATTHICSAKLCVFQHASDIWLYIHIYCVYIEKLATTHSHSATVFLCICKRYICIYMYEITMLEVLKWRYIATNIVTYVATDCIWNVEFMINLVIHLRDSCDPGLTDLEYIAVNPGLMHMKYITFFVLLNKPVTLPYYVSWE